MHEPERHDMYLEKIYPSGMEEWHCASCDKCLLVTWEPTFSIITQEDNKYVIHKMSEDGSLVESTRIESANEIVQPEESGAMSEEERLSPWLAWMEEIGFENLWEDEDQ